VKGRKEKAAHAARNAEGTPSEKLVLDPDVFSQKHDGAHEADTQ
jgi:hypothetical protein